MVKSIGTYTEIDSLDKIKKEEVCIDSFFEELKKTLNNFFIKHKAEVQFINLTDKKTIQQSRLALTLLLKNLIENGIKYNQSENPVVRVSIKKQDEGILISVQDNGIGIDESYFNYIFKPFKTLKAKNESNSSGLGLAICQSIIKLSEGKIWAASKEDEGSTFFVWLPEKDTIDSNSDLITSNIKNNPDFKAQ